MSSRTSPWRAARLWTTRTRNLASVPATRTREHLTIETEQGTDIDTENTAALQTEQTE